MAKFNNIRLDFGYFLDLSLEGKDLAHLASRLWFYYRRDIHSDDLGGAWSDLQDLADYATRELERAIADRETNERFPESVVLSDWLLLEGGADMDALPSLLVTPLDDDLWTRIMIAFGLYRLDIALAKISQGDHSTAANDLAIVANVASDVGHMDGMSRQLQLTRREKSIKAKSMAETRKLKDPKQQAKGEVFLLWNNWQQKKWLYTSSAAFARDMLTKFPTLESQPVIERWCRDWSRQASSDSAE